MSSILVGQSGGPTAVINSSLAGIFYRALSSKKFDHIYGLRYGISGLLNEDFYEIKNQEQIDLIRCNPGAFLGSVRFKIKDEYEKIVQIFKKYDVKCFFYIGGNDSMDTCNKIYQYFKEINFDCKVIGVPKTIDNDLLIDHCPGYGSAAKFIATSIEELYLDTNVYNKGRVNIVEIMGRDAGWLTASASIASINKMGPDFIYLPESKFDIKKFLEDVLDTYNKKHTVLIAVSEGIKIDDEKHLLTNNDFDVFGHIQLGGIGQKLAEIIKKELNLPIRAIELNLLQRCAFHIASKFDFDEAYDIGIYAVDLALSNKSGVMAIKDKVIQLNDVANKVKYFPINWIINGNQISEEYLKYVLPLIKGEVNLKYENGIPKYYKID